MMDLRDLHTNLILTHQFKAPCLLLNLIVILYMGAQAFFLLETTSTLLSLIHPPSEPSK